MIFFPYFIQKMNTNGVCAFDIDNTLTCGSENCTDKKQFILNTINQCVENNFKIVLNTARPPQEDILWGIDADITRRLNDASEGSLEVYMRPEDGLDVPEHKFLNNSRIAANFNVPMNKVVLVDDNMDTINHITNLGFDAVHVSGEKGIDLQTCETLSNIIGADNTRCNQ
jgi:FMN phosphatase YigB (HAD superfamily)